MSEIRPGDRCGTGPVKGVEGTSGVGIDGTRTVLHPCASV